MKLALLALILTTVAPVHLTVGPVTLSVAWLLASAELLAAAGSAWLAVRHIRRHGLRLRYAHSAGGAW